MRIGLDIHGVLDHYPEKFIKIAIENIQAKGAAAKIAEAQDLYRNYVITGPTRAKALKELQALADQYNGGQPFWDEVFSIVDYIVENDIPHTVDEKGHVWTLVNEDWNKVKGILAKELKLDIHYDDSMEYEQYFPAGVFCYVRRRKD
ncbi:MAG: hypothetical protein PHY47_01150 [Lachnospiraceae bacterium]|nr:hypothetical protein [Lachnospiraceae bacterium]